MILFVRQFRPEIGRQGAKMGTGRGKFIVFEGIDGSGKSTQINRAASFVSAKGIRTVLTSEPQDDRPTGKLLRDVLSGRVSGDPRVVSALFAADRLDHITRSGGIADCINAGKYVFCDRFYLSSYAYNSNGVDMDYVIALNSEAVKLCKPDLHIFIDVPVDTALRRLENRRQKEIYEKREFLEAICKKYHSLIESLKDTENIFIIDGTQSSAAVAEAIRNKINSME